jgi:protein-S-isoprenylcysteine O-methyltransferase Ste14
MGVAVSGALALPHPAFSGPLRWIALALGLVLVGSGGWLTLAGLRGLGRNLSAAPRPRSNAELVREGPYRRIRHPIYAGIIAGSFGWGLMSASPLSLGFAAALTIWFDLKSRREERWLDERYPAYATYVASTNRFIPGVY